MLPRNKREPTDGKVYVMGRALPFATTGAVSKTPIEPLLLCADCSTEMRLFGIEAESENRDLYTFECMRCGVLEVRGVRAR
jgi:hypothetical protein